MESLGDNRGFLDGQRIAFTAADVFLASQWLVD